MAQRKYSIDLQNISFPMLSEQQTRTIIGSTAGEAPSKEDKPGVAYCHNVVPSRYGMDSVGYLSVIPAATAGVFIDVRPIYGDELNLLYLAWDSVGSAYSLEEGATSWLPLSATVPVTGGSGFTSESVTVGTVNGVSYIFYSGIGAFTYDESTNALVEAVLVGLDIASVLGVVASSGYLIAYTKRAIAWSSTLLATDFVPSSVTGSGGGNVAGIAGAILFCTANPLGILVYTRANTVAGTYTGNTQFPFKFRPVDDSKGGLSLDKVAYEDNAKLQFVYSKAGLQTVTSQRADIILPDTTDFLAGKRFEDYNESTGLYEVTDLDAATTMQKKIKFVASRYLIISYGISSFTHALIYDTAMQKLGKLRITHADVFEYVGAQTEISRESVAFLLPTGEVKVLDFSTSADSNGVVILGKLQFTRTRMMTLLGVDIENVESASSLDVSSQVSLDGKTFTEVAGKVDESVENLRTYHFLDTGMNHSLVFKGKFNLTTAEIVFTTAGRR